MNSPQIVDRQATVDFREYLGVMRRRWRVVAAATLVSLAAAAAHMAYSDPHYRAFSTVRVAPVNIEPGRPVSRPDLLPNMDSEQQVLRSTTLLTQVRRRLGRSLSLAELQRGLRLTVPQGTDVIVIGFEHRDPTLARVVAQTVAEVYLSNRTQTAETIVGQRAARFDQRILAAEREIAALQRSYRERQRPDPAQRSRESFLLGQLEDLHKNRNRVLVLSTHAGEILTPAKLPSQPLPSRTPLVLGLAISSGAIAGVALAFLRDRTDRRVREASDVQREVGIPVVAQLSSCAESDTRADPMSIQRLRGAFLRIAELQAVRSVAISTPNSGRECSVLAVNLATSLVRANRRVLLVSADLREGSLHTILGINDEPGLADVLHGQRSIQDVVVHPRAEPRLAVIPSGRPRRDVDDLLHAPHLRRLAQAEEYDFVIFSSPAVLDAPDATTIGATVDGLLLVARVDDTRRADLATAVEWLEEGGVRVLGAVLAAASHRRRCSDPPAPATSRLRVGSPAEAAIGKALGHRSELSPDWSVRHQVVKSISLHRCTRGVDVAPSIPSAEMRPFRAVDV